MSIFGSSNWTSPSSDSQREHNKFTTKPWIYDWLEASSSASGPTGTGHSETKPFVPLPPDAPGLQPAGQRRAPASRRPASRCRSTPGSGRTSTTSTSAPRRTRRCSRANKRLGPSQCEHRLSLLRAADAAAGHALLLEDRLEDDGAQRRRTVRCGASRPRARRRTTRRRPSPSRRRQRRDLHGAGDDHRSPRRRATATARSRRSTSTPAATLIGTRHDRAVQRHLDQRRRRQLHADGRRDRQRQRDRRRPAPCRSRRKRRRPRGCPPAGATPTSARPARPAARRSRTARSASAGAGADVWGTADAFHYAYRTLDGDGTIVARVASIQNVNAWTKAGVMIRNSLSPSAAQGFMLVAASAAKGVPFQRRRPTAAQRQHVGQPVHRAALGEARARRQPDHGLRIARRLGVDDRRQRHVRDGRDAS